MVEWKKEGKLNLERVQPSGPKFQRIKGELKFPLGSQNGKIWLSQKRG